MRKIYMAKCACGHELFFDEKPHALSLIRVGEVSGTFPLQCKCGGKLEASDFKYTEYEEKGDK